MIYRLGDHTELDSYMCSIDLFILISEYWKIIGNHLKNHEFKSEFRPFSLVCAFTNAIGIEHINTGTSCKVIFAQLLIPFIINVPNATYLEWHCHIFFHLNKTLCSWVPWKSLPQNIFHLDFAVGSSDLLSVAR